MSPSNPLPPDLDTTTDDDDDDQHNQHQHHLAALEADARLHQQQSLLLHQLATSIGQQQQQLHQSMAASAAEPPPLISKTAQQLFGVDSTGSQLSADGGHWSPPTPTPLRQQHGSAFPSDMQLSAQLVGAAAAAHLAPGHTSTAARRRQRNHAHGTCVLLLFVAEIRDSYRVCVCVAENFGPQKHLRE